MKKIAIPSASPADKCLYHIGSSMRTHYKQRPMMEQ